MGAALLQNAAHTSIHRFSADLQVGQWPIDGNPRPWVCLVIPNILERFRNLQKRALFPRNQRETVRVSGPRAHCCPFKALPVSWSRLVVPEIDRVVLRHFTRGLQASSASARIEMYICGPQVYLRQHRWFRRWCCEKRYQLPVRSRRLPAIHGTQTHTLHDSLSTMGVGHHGCFAPT